MKRTFFTETGIEIKELTDDDLIKFANLGDMETQLELAKKQINKSLTIEERLALIEQFLGLK